MKFSTERPYFWLFAALALIGLTADLASKYVVFAKLYPDDPRQQVTAVKVIPDLFSLQTNYSPISDPGDQPLSFLRTISGPRLPYVNRGALFGWGNGEGGPDLDDGMNAVFLCISLVAAGVILFWVQRPNVAQDRWLCLALGLILAGTLGNLFDRVVFGGVRDFLHCYCYYAGKLRIWPDFNIADCCLVCGAGVLLVHSFFTTDPAAESAKTEVATESLQTTSSTSGA